MPTSVKADYSEPTCMYHMAGNFRGVLIFTTFVVDLAVMKLFHPRKLIPTVIIMVMQVHDDGRDHQHRGSVANTSQC